MPILVRPGQRSKPWQLTHESIYQYPTEGLDIVLGYPYTAICRAHGTPFRAAKVSAKRLAPWVLAGQAEIHDVWCCQHFGCFDTGPSTHENIFRRDVAMHESAPVDAGQTP